MSVQPSNSNNPTKDHNGDDNEKGPSKWGGGGPLQHFCDGFHRNDATLTICNLHNVPLGNRGAQFLASALQTCKSSSTGGGSVPLVVLFADNCGMGDVGCMALADSLAQHAPNLKYLYLSYNHISNRGATALARLLETTTTTTTSTATTTTTRTGCQLKTLKLAHNSIGTAGAERLAQALRGGNNEHAEQQPALLQVLDLEGNSIQVAGLVALADSLTENTHLQQLNVQQNLWRHSKRHLQERRAVQQAFLNVLRETTPDQKNHNCTLHELLLDQATTNPAITTTTTTTTTAAAQRHLQESWKQEQELCAQLNYWLSLNRLGRRAFGNVHVPPAAWTRVLARAAATTACADAATKKSTTQRQDSSSQSSSVQQEQQQSTDLLYTLLQTRPDLLCSE